MFEPNDNFSFANSPAMLGDLIRRERIAQGMSQVQMAAQTHTRRQTIAALELGSNVGIHTLFAVLGVLGKRVELPATQLELDRVHEYLGEDWQT